MTKDTKFLDILNFIKEHKLKLNEKGEPEGFYTDDEYIEMIGSKFYLDRQESIAYYNSVLLEFSNNTL